MELFINASGGIAGDMFAAALINAGASEIEVTNAMLTAAQTIGRASVMHLLTNDGSSRMKIEVEHHHGHLSSHKALHFLEHLLKELKIKHAYRELAVKILYTLIKAEKEAHESHDFEMDTHHFHHHHHHPENNENKSSHPSHKHPHYSEPEAWLHEAQDILIDIIGAVSGLQSLGAPVTATLTAPVAYGGGSVSFSHGNLSVPAPATKVMIETNHIPVTAGPLETELFTPTGAAIISALKAFHVSQPPSKKILYHGKSRGTKDLPIPPLEIILY